MKITEMERQLDIREFDEKRRIVHLLRLLFRSSEELIITNLSNNLDLLDFQFGYDYLLDPCCVCMNMLEQVKHNNHIFDNEKIVDSILHGKCCHVKSKCNQTYIRQAKTSFLILSCVLQKLEVVKFLCRQNLSVNQKTFSMNLTPLHAAILSKNIEVFKFILSLGADVNATCMPCTNKLSSLMLAILEGANDMVPILLSQENTNKTYINNQSKTALCCAAEVNSVEIVDMLIKAGLKATNITICKAVQTDNAELLKLVLSSRRYFMPQFQTYALHTAVKLSNKKMLELLLERGFHFNHGTNILYDQESLHLAVLRSDSEMVKILLKHQIKLDSELNGFTALDWAVLMDYDDIVKIIKNEYRLRCIKPCKKDVKHLVIEALFRRDGINRSNVIRKLIYKGFNVNELSRDGYSMLHEAVFDHDSDSVKTLLELGADPDILSNCEPAMSPLYVAVDSGNIKAAKLLLAANASLDFVATYENINDQLGNIDQNEAGFILNPTDLPKDRSLLCAAVCKNLTEMVWLLLLSGYKVHLEKRSSFDWMVEKTKSDEIRHLLTNERENPKSLLVCCRDYIRKWRKYDLQEFVDNQCIPQQLKETILLKDVLNNNLRTCQKFCYWKNFYH